MMNELSLLDGLLNSTLRNYSTSGFTPDVDIVENKENYEVTMDLPGMTENDVDISVNDNVLTIKSIKSSKEEKKEVKDENKTSYLVHERRSLSFSRSFTLPRDVETQNITASFNSGVLTITVPRKPDAQPRKIAITVA